MQYYEADPHDAVFLGRLGENQTRAILFPVVKQWKETFGDGTFALLHQRNGDAQPYPCTVQTDGENVVWAIQSADVAAEGEGQGQLIYVVDDAVAKDQIFTTLTGPALGEPGEVPEAWEGWTQEVILAGTQAQESAEQALSAAAAAREAAESAPYIGENGNWWVWDADAGEFADTEVSAGSSSTGGTTDHTQLSNRDAADQHPMSAITGLETALSGKQAAISDLATIRSGAALGATAQQPPAAETYAIAAASWTALSDAAPYTVSASVTATHGIGANTICELINDQAVLFANCGLAIGAVSGQSVTFYAVKAPTASVTLEVEYYG